MADYLIQNKSLVWLWMVFFYFLRPLLTAMMHFSLKLMVLKLILRAYKLMFVSALLKHITLTGTACFHHASTTRLSSLYLLLALPPSPALKMWDSTLFLTFHSNSRPSFQSALLKTGESSTVPSSLTVPFGSHATLTFATAWRWDPIISAWPLCSTHTL